jgi:hypothetical protein
MKQYLLLKLRVEPATLSCRCSTTTVNSNLFHPLMEDTNAYVPPVLQKMKPYTSPRYVVVSFPWRTPYFFFGVVNVGIMIAGNKNG